MRKGSRRRSTGIRRTCETGLNLLMKKKILLMVPRVHQGGQERICLLTARLLEKEHSVTVLIFDDADCVYDLSGLRLINLHSPARPGKLRKIINVALRSLKTGRIKKRERFDICYSFGATANLVNIFSRKGERVWTGIRGYDDVDDTKRTGLFCRFSDRVICCARVMAEDLKDKYHPGDVVSIYNPCDLEMIRRQGLEELPEEEKAFFAEGNRVIVSMGRESHLKGYWHLLKAFSLTAARVGEARLMIMGRGTYEPYKRLAEELGISDKVWFAGVKSNPFCYLSRASLYVLSSQDGEGFPNALAEAMASGLPVAAVNCKSGPAEMLMEDYKKAADRTRAYDADYGVLLPVCRDEENFDASHIENEERIMGEQLTALLTDQEKAEKYRAAARLRAEDFSAEAYRKRLSALL